MVGYYGDDIRPYFDGLFFPSCLSKGAGDLGCLFDTDAFHLCIASWLLFAPHFGRLGTLQSGTFMILTPKNSDFVVGDGIPVKFDCVSYPISMIGLDVRPQIRYEQAPGHRPPVDMVQRLRSHLVGAELLRLNAIDTKFCNSLADHWGIDKKAAMRMARLYQSGAGSVTGTKLQGLKLSAPGAWEIASMPWDLLIPRESAALEGMSEKARLSGWSSYGDFWEAVYRLRVALRVGDIDPIARSARAMLEALPFILSVPMVRKVAVEFVDLVHRLIYVLPHPLLKGSVRTDMLLKELLTRGEVLALMSTRPNFSLPLLSSKTASITSDKNGSTTFSRYMFAKATSDADFFNVARKSWGFIPQVLEKYAELDTFDDLAEALLRTNSMRI